jgi:hypothetical protein
MPSMESQDYSTAMGASAFAYQVCGNFQLLSLMLNATCLFGLQL